MRIEQLEYIAAVNQLGSLRRASEHLHISQPALSEAVSKLEKELGVSLLDRRRTGSRISRRGRDLLPHITRVLEAVDQLRSAAGDDSAGGQLVRLGTVNTATTQVLFPSLRSYAGTDPSAVVEVLDMLPAEMLVGLEESTIDLGLANLLDGDDLPLDIQATPLLRGRPVMVLPAHHRLAEYAELPVDELRHEPFILMRNGYSMHRLAKRLFGDQLPPGSRGADGAEMGKLMVAEELGLTLLPDFSVAGDPLERSGGIVARPVVGLEEAVTLTMLHRRGAHHPEHVQAMAATLIARTRAFSRQRRDLEPQDAEPMGGSAKPAFEHGSADRNVV